MAARRSLSLDRHISTVGDRLGLVCSLLAIAWAVELVDQLLLGRSLDRYGIRPHTLQGLWGILFAPFLHGGFGHLIANSGPFVVLGWLVALRGVGRFVAVSLIVIVIGGLGVWLFGPSNTVHIGASGLIFGYLGYLLLSGYFEQKPGSILVAVVVGLLYGGAIWGVLPGQRGISWQGHLFGLLAGVLAARLLAQTKR